MRDIVIERLCKSYGGKRVLDNFSAVFPSGMVSAIMAPSGGGKTTLLRILMGLETADGGSVTGLHNLRLSAVFQEDRLLERLSPISNIRLVAPEVTREEAQAALGEVGLADCCDQPVSELSGGMRRRAAIMRALLAKYDVLFLDEPFKGLDADTKALVMKDTASRSAGRTVLLVTHEMSEAEAMGAARMIELPAIYF